MNTYEQVADFFLSTITGAASARMAGLDRAGLIEVMRQKYPNEADLKVHFESLKAQAQMMASACMKPS